MQQIKATHEKGRGVIGMKIVGNGLFTNAADREKSIRFAMACRDIDAVVIGFKTTQEIDEAIARIEPRAGGRSGTRRSRRAARDGLSYPPLVRNVFW